MLKKVCANASNPPIPIKTLADGLKNIASHQLPSLQCTTHRPSALMIEDSLARLKQFKTNLSKCFEKPTKKAVKEEKCAISNISSALYEAESTHLDDLFSAAQKKLVPNQLQNYIFARNYSSKSNECSASKKGGDKGGKKKDNLTAVLHAIDDLRLEQRPIPKIGDTDVLIAMDCVGICGSDVHYWVKGHIGDFVLKKPMVIGHEGAGIIEEVGKKVKNLKKGDRVAIEPGYPCRVCDFCKQGKYHLCPGMIFCATPPYDGNLTRYYKHPADFCFKIPEYMTMEEAVLLEPLAVGVHSSVRAGITLGSEALIFGSGPVGLTTLTVAKAMGATKGIVVDIKEDRLKVAKKMGADLTILIKGDEDPKELAKKIIKKNNGSMPDKSFDCVGTEQALKTGIFVII